MIGATPASPTLIILCGLPFSGKTTLGRVLSNGIGAVHLEMDRIVVEQGGSFEPGGLSNEVWIAAYKEGHRRLDRLLAAGRPVVWDAVSFRWSHREKLRRMASQHGVRSYLIWLDILLPEINRRRVANQLSRSRGDVADADFAMVANGFQPPRAEEGAVRYDPMKDSIPMLIDRLNVFTIPA